MHQQYLVLLLISSIDFSFQCLSLLVAILMNAFFSLGAYDILQQPKNISETAKKNVCFFMFVDEETEEFLRNSSGLDNRMKLGLWRIVVVHNLPYTDPRRNGKVNLDQPWVMRNQFAFRVNSLEDICLS